MTSFSFGRVWKKKSNNEINKKHPSINFDQEYSKSESEFLVVLIYKDEQQRLQITLLNKKRDRKSYIYPKSDNPASLKKSVPYNKYCVSKEFAQ